MAVTHAPFPIIPPVPGFRMASTACGIKQNGQTDLLLVEMAPSSVAGVFTRNLIKAHPVILCQQRLAHPTAQALLVNSGNANAANGIQGLKDAQTLSKKVSDLLNLPEESVFVASTGIIGQNLPTQNALQAIPKLVAQLTPEGWEEGAKAIMTTDTFPKGGFRIFKQNSKDTLLAGIAKGSGMIHPNMATMLGFLFTDAAITSSALNTLLQRAVQVSFNSITVDGDTSTNDTVLLFASGHNGETPIENPDDPQAKPLADALTNLCQELAQTIVRDGEGASKFIQITVEQASTPEMAKQVALSIAKSPLVKTACAGSDPNWGRILNAVGYSGVTLDPNQIDLFLDHVLVVKNGQRSPLYTDDLGEAVMQKEEITLTITLGLGDFKHTIWTCDLTHDYISINADYHT